MEMLFSVATFFLFLIFVALYSYRKTKGVSESGVEGFFLAGRGLSGYFIAGSLLLSNLSAEQLVGLNGNAYRFDISGMARESTAAVATIMMAVFSCRVFYAAALPQCRSFWRSVSIAPHGERSA